MQKFWSPHYLHRIIGYLRLTGLSPSIFSVDLGLGVVYLNESLAGAGPWECTLTLMAQDLGVPPQASLLVLTVIIEKIGRAHV